MKKIISGIIGTSIIANTLVPISVNATNSVAVGMTPTADKRVSIIENRLDELENRLTLLESENEELKNQTKILTDTIMQMINKFYGDINGDNVIDGRDATLLLTYYAKISIGYTGTLEEFVVNVG